MQLGQSTQDVCGHVVEATAIDLTVVGLVDPVLPAPRQQALKEDLDEIGLEDPYVDEELALLESLMANIDDLGRPRPEASDED